MGLLALETPYRRAIAVFRMASLGYAAILILRPGAAYAHPAGAWAVLAVMTAWTAYVTYAYARAPVEAGRSRPGRPLLVADLAVAAACVLATWWVQTPENIAHGARTLPVLWVAAPMLAWAVTGGKRYGAVAAGVLSAADIGVHVAHGQWPTAWTFNSVVLLFIVGIIIGHVAELAAEAERRLARAIEMEAAQRERDRLARSIHDSVLQVLALVQRRGTELGGEAAELGRLAGEQEAALRALVGSGERRERGESAARAERGEHERRERGSRGGRSSAREAAPGGDLDLCDLLAPHSSATVTVATPATPVRLPAHVARELAAAVAAALDNVRLHCGAAARAWILVEDEGDAVTVSVRDDGPGIPDGRLEEAAADGRLGVAQSIKGRVRDLGGTVLITSGPGDGTELELRVPLG